MNEQKPITMRELNEMSILYNISYKFNTKRRDPLYGTFSIGLDKRL